MILRWNQIITEYFQAWGYLGAGDCRIKVSTVILIFRLGIIDSEVISPAFEADCKHTLNSICVPTCDFLQRVFSILKE